MRYFTFIAALLLVSLSTTAQPIIGISASDSESSVSAPMTYIRSVRNAGGVPLIIPWTTDEVQLKKILETIDALVMTGGEDVDPLAYDGEEPHPKMGEIVPLRDAFDAMILKMAVEKDIPVLGICRGIQMINVLFGGSLYQDIPSQVKDSFVDHYQNAPRNYGTHTITIDKKSLLYSLLGSESVVVNSYHHQSVKKVAPGFKIVAVSKDGIIEAIEKIDSGRVLGVQFHPEGFACEGDSKFSSIFRWLVEEAAK